MENLNKKAICFDPELCLGCYSCVVSCMDQNDIDVEADELSWRHIEQVEQGKPEPAVSYVSIACMHCEDAPCIAACPSGALARDAQTGNVIVRSKLCIGCHACAMACPFGAPRFGVSGKMQKCDGCANRTAFGYEPACVHNCPTGALSFGDINEQMETRSGAAARTLAR